MEYMDLVRKRRSIRRYKSDPIPEQYVKTILEAARLAPFSGNRQCWRYIIVTDQDIKKRLAEAEGKWASEAPVIIVACADPKALRTSQASGSPIQSNRQDGAAL